MTRDGSPIIVHSREVLVRDEHGGRLAVLSIKRDITELRHAIQALHEADRRKDEFLATLAHELRNPLAPVRNAVEIMRIAGDNPATVARVRDMLDRQVQQLSRIVDDLIDVTRIVEKKIDLRRERVPLTQVVDTALETCRSRIEGRRQRLSVSIPVSPIVVDVDPVRMSQVLINLLDNASKYTDAGGQIWLSAEPQAGGNGSDHPSVAIRVRDTGIGIPSEVLPDRVRHVHAGRPHPGTGARRARRRTRAGPEPRGNAQWCHHRGQRRGREGVGVRGAAAGERRRRRGRQGASGPRRP